jgi:hypothetical protein
MRDDTLSIQVLRNVRDGDVVWVTVRADADTDEIEVVQTVVAANLNADATVLVTTAGFLDDLKRASLDELMSLRDRLDVAISGYVSEHTTAEA